MPLWVVGGGHHPPPSLLDFLVHLMLAAKRAELLKFNPLGSGLFILGAAIVFSLAFSTLKSDNFAHVCSLSVARWWVVGRSFPTTYLPPPTTFIPISPLLFLPLRSVRLRESRTAILCPWPPV